MKHYTDKELADYLLEMRRYGGRARLRNYFQKYKWRLISFFALVIILFVLGVFAQSWWFCGFIFGLVFGILSRDRAHVRQLNTVWPFYGKVIDWLKVEKIANGEPSA